MDSPQRAVTSLLTGITIQDGALPPYWKKENNNRQNSAAISDIFTKFGALMAIGSPQRALMSFLGYTKIQDGGRPPFWKTEKRKNSTALWDVFTNSLTKPQILFIKKLQAIYLMYVV